MLTSDIHRPVRDADAALPHRDEERLLGVIPLTDRRKVMVVVGHVVEAANGTDSTATGPLNDDALVIDRDSWQVWAYGKPVSLSYQEFRLLAHLASAPGRVFTRQELLDQVWAPEAHTTARSVDVHVHRIRRKLGAPGERLVTVRRVGSSTGPADTHPSLPAPPSCSAQQKDAAHVPDLPLVPAHAGRQPRPRR